VDEGSPAGGQKPVVFTDLDGTLLDHHTYEWTAAGPALAMLRREQIPLVLCSSKTASEIMPLRQVLNNRDPFIVENGGAVFIPSDYFTTPPPDASACRGYHVIELGRSYAELRRILHETGRDVGLPIRGCGDMDADEFSRLTGLPLAAARLAMVRAYDEPFLIDAPPEHHPVVLDRLRARGMHWTLGGRFYHVTGGHDKGIAVRRLSSLYEREYGSLLTIGLGDSLNDLPMLRAVDHPILVRKSNGSYDPAVSLEGLEYAEGIGPEGWNRALLRLIDGKTPPPSSPPSSRASR
jgi:mannosyl-3-phosphoglycerate phosphatase